MDVQKMFTLNYCLILIAMFHYCALGYRILGIFPMPMYSHYKIASSVLMKLAKSGHDVVVINPYPQNSPVENYRDVSVASITRIIGEFKEELYTLESEWDWRCIRFLTSMGYTMTVETLKHESVQKLLASPLEHFDLVISAQFMNEAHMAIAQHYNAPLILLATMPLFPWTNFYLATPGLPSYVPSLLGHFSGQMSFIQRLRNTVHTLFAIAYYEWVILPKHRRLAKELIPNGPDLDASLYNVSLVLVNAHESIYHAIPYSPNVIPIGGVHIDDGDSQKFTSQQSLLEIMSTANHGIVVISMGSNLRSTGLSVDCIRIIAKVLGMRPETVIWKWESDDFPFDVPVNFYLQKWLPLQSVLAHPKVKLFIMHGGLLSTMESIYSGVPMLGIPIFTDQKMNVATGVARGYALQLNLRDFTEESFSRTLNELLRNDSKFKKKAEELSQIMHDRPIPPVELSKYWIEYVARHRGAPHLRHSGVNLYWFQRLLLDIGLFVVMCIWCIWIVLKRASITIMFRRANKKTKLK